MDPEIGTVEAVAVLVDLILDVGTFEETLRYLGPSTEAVDVDWVIGGAHEAAGPHSLQTPWTQEWRTCTRERASRRSRSRTHGIDSPCSTMAIHSSIQGWQVRRRNVRGRALRWGIARFGSLGHDRLQSCTQAVERVRRGVHLHPAASRELDSGRYSCRREDIPFTILTQSQAPYLASML